MSNFPFIQDNILKENLDIAFQHVLDLLILINSGDYDKVSRNSFRKSTIICTASVIEALLFVLLKENLSEEDLEIPMWKIKNEKILYEIDEEYKIVAGDYKVERKKIEFKKLNLGQINSSLENNKIIEKDLFKKIDKVRKLRNDQHFGTHSIVKSYTKKDLDLVFTVAKEVKDLFY